MLWLAIFKVHKILENRQASQKVLDMRFPMLLTRCPSRYSYFPTAASIRGADYASFALPRLKTDILTIIYLGIGLIIVKLHSDLELNMN